MAVPSTWNLGPDGSRAVGVRQDPRPSVRVFDERKCAETRKHRGASDLRGTPTGAGRVGPKGVLSTADVRASLHVEEELIDRQKQSKRVRGLGSFGVGSYAVHERVPRRRDVIRIEVEPGVVVVLQKLDERLG